jgi:probable HAF family extracellular repeat protein
MCYKMSGMVLAGAMASLVLCGVGVALAAPTYTVTDLGALFGSQMSDAYGINNNGQVVGEFQRSSGNWEAFLYSNGIITVLGSCTVVFRPKWHSG